jgi:hypothetical protein
MLPVESRLRPYWPVPLRQYALAAVNPWCSCLTLFVLLLLRALLLVGQPAR